MTESPKMNVLFLKKEKVIENQLSQTWSIYISAEFSKLFCTQKSYFRIIKKKKMYKKTTKQPKQNKKNPT